MVPHNYCNVHMCGGKWFMVFTGAPKSNYVKNIKQTDQTWFYSKIVLHPF